MFRFLRCAACARILLLLLMAAPALAMDNPALVRDCFPGSESASPFQMTPVGGNLFFRVRHTGYQVANGFEIWKSDGTTSGTVLVKDIWKDYAADAAPGSDNAWPTAVGGLLFFAADDGVHGWELWKSDGTPAGTVLVRDIRGDASHVAGDGPRNLVALAGLLFFTADDGVNGRELWTSDGTAAGTRMCRDIDAHPGASSNPEYPTPLGSSIYFSASDGIDGAELWKSDGSAAGTVRVANLNPRLPGETTSPGSAPYGLTAVGDTLFFLADDGTHGYALWKAALPGPAVSLVKDIDAASYQFFTGGRTLLYFWTGWTGVGLWRSDGTAAGTLQIGSFPSYGGEAYQPAVLGDILYFCGYDSAAGWELMRSDGSAAGTRVVRDIAPGAASSLPSLLTPRGESLYFYSQYGTGLHLWKTDGTAPGTVPLADPGPVISIQTSEKPADANGFLFFGADDGSHGYELWAWRFPVRQPARACGDWILLD